MKEKKNRIKKDLFNGIVCKEGNRQTAGITLIALVLTIIILIILASVTINTLVNNGIIDKAKTAKQEYLNAQNSEETEIAKLSNEIDIHSNREYITISTEDLNRLILEGIETYKTENNIGKFYSTTTLVNTNMLAGGNGPTNALSLTLEPGKYIISGFAYGTGTGLGTGTNEYIILDGDHFWADEGASTIFRGTGTIVRNITTTKKIDLNIYTATAFNVTSGYIYAIKVSD